MTQPLAPRNVVAHLIGGVKIKLALKFVGTDERGINVWRTTRPIDRRLLRTVTVGFLPGRTTIVVAYFEGPSN